MLTLPLSCGCDPHSELLYPSFCLLTSQVHGGGQQINGAFMVSSFRGLVGEEVTESETMTKLYASMCAHTKEGRLDCLLLIRTATFDGRTMIE